jgi:hypothetical protein
MPFSIQRDSYSAPDYRDSLADAIVSSRGYAFSAMLGILTDGEIRYACSTNCLRGMIANMDTADQLTLAVNETDRVTRAGTQAEYPRMIAEDTDRNEWCDHCHAQIGDHFGDCLFCNSELIRYEDGSESEFYFGTTHYANDDRFGGICDKCLPMWELTSVGADGAPMMWDDLDSNTAERMVELYGPDYAQRIETAFMVYAFHDPRTMRGEREAAAIEVLGGPRDYSRGNVRDDRVWHIIRREIIRRTHDARGIMELPGVEWSTLDAPLEIPGEWFGSNWWNAQGFALAVCGLVPESV